MLKYNGDINTFLAKSEVMLLLSFVLSSVFLWFFSFSTSPAYSFEGGDSSVFKIMGQAILQGRIPYKDIFDHKGPILYFIEAFGQLLYSGRVGIFIIQIINLTTSVYLWLKTSRLFVSPLISLICVAITLSFLFFTYTGGNISEEFSLLFISLALFESVKIILSLLKHSLLRTAILIGVCFGLSFFIRPNDAVAFIGGLMVGTFIFLVYKKEKSQVLWLLCGYSIGFLVILIPLLIFFGINGAIGDLYYGLIDYNSQYAGGFTTLLIDSFRKDKRLFLSIMVIPTLLVYSSKYRNLLFLLVPSFIFGFLLLGGWLLEHYLIVWLPSVFLMSVIFLFEQKNKCLSVVSIIVVLLFCRCMQWRMLKLPIEAYKTVRNYCNQDDYYKKLDEGVKALFDGMSKDDKKKIWNYNLAWGGVNSYNRFGIYNCCSIVPCNRVPLLFMAKVDQELVDNEELTLYRPAFVLISSVDELPKTYLSRDSTYIQNNYHIYAQIDECGVRLTMYKLNCYENKN